MVVVRMTWAINAADTVPARRAADGCESPWIQPIMLPFLGSIVPAKPSTACHRLVSSTRFNSTFSTKTIRLFGVHERTNLRISKGIRPVLLLFLGSTYRMPLNSQVYESMIVPIIIHTPGLTNVSVYWQKLIFWVSA